MSKATATRGPAAIPRIQETPAYREAEARRLDVANQLREAEANLESRRRQHDQGWQEEHARAISEGRPAPPRQELGDVDDLVERVATLIRASTLARQRLEATANAESERVLDAVAARRSELARGQSEALAALIQATGQYQALRAELDALGVDTTARGAWLSPFEAAFLEEIAGRYASQSSDA